MKNIYSALVICAFLVSCSTTETKSENQVGIIENNDSKSLVMDSFNNAYLANDMTGQEEIFTDSAVAHVNSQDMTPAEMIGAFMGGRSFYNDINYSNRVTATFVFDSSDDAEGDVYSCTWFTWEGTSKATGVVVSNPVHAWFKWEGDKVSEVAYIFDPTEYVANMAPSN